MSSIFQILLKENIWKILKNVFFTLFIQSIVVFLFLCPQFPDSKGKTKKGIFVSISCNSKRLVTSSRHFAFQNFVYKKWLDAKEKIKFPFSWSLLKYLIFKKLIHALTVLSYLGYLVFLKSGMELVFTAGVLHTFSIKMFLIKYPIKWPSFNI